MARTDSTPSPTRTGSLAGQSDENLAFNLAALGLILIMAGLGTAYWLNGYAREKTQLSPSSFTPPLVSKTLAGNDLQIPKSWLTPLIQDSRKQVQAIDLSLKITLEQEMPPASFNLRISPLEMAEPSSYLLDSVYILKFSDQQIDAIKGLVGKPMRAEDGYENETVWYQPTTSTPFVAKCIDLENSESALNCLRTIRLNSSLALTYQFSQERLASWQNMDRAIMPLLQKTGIVPD